MAKMLKACVNGAWQMIQNLYRGENGAWVKRHAYVGLNNAWVKITEETYVTEYAITNKQTYWSSGSQDNQTSTLPHLIQGSYDNTLGNRRGTLCWFNDAQIRADLAGAEIDYVEVYMKRISDIHGQTTAEVHIGRHNVASEPGTYFSDLAVLASPQFVRGEAKWVPVPHEFGEMLRDNTEKGIGVIVMSTSQLYYARMDQAVTKLRITYRK